MMTKIQDISNYINEIAPYNTKCEWDNCGLLVGDSNKIVNKIGFCLDLTAQTLADAIENEVDLIITHHPIIFKVQKSFLSGNMAFELAKNNISAISAHTCYDVADEGVNDVLADVLGLKNTVPVATDDCVKPMLRLGETEKMSGEAFASLVAQKLGTTVRFVDTNKDVEKVAVCGGAGMSFMHEVIAAGADAFVTGDISHHEMLDSKALGLNVVAAGHFETENPSIPFLKSKVAKEFSDIQTILLKQDNPIKFIG